MNFSVDFYKDEVRNGFYIPTAVKQAWAANLRVLNEIDRICEKHGISYYADWGSILGAVRHGGYVPWDDDLDICMKREDYIRFRQVADTELPTEFAIHDFRSKDNHWLFLARVVNSNQICFDEKHLEEYHNFPYIAVVDIFIKDYLYRDPDKKSEWIKEIKRLIAIADGIVENGFKSSVIEKELSDIENRYNVTIDRRLSSKELGILLYGIAEQQMGRVSYSEADEIGQLFPMVLMGGAGQPKEYYEKMIRLPFENTTIPVPARYNEILRNRYGNYLEINKIWAGHNYPYFEGQRANLIEVSDFELPEFTFKSEMLEAVDREKSVENSLVGMSKPFCKQLSEMNEELCRCLNEKDIDGALGLLPELQQFVVDYGTLVEQVKSEERESCRQVVSAIQCYCDAMYEIYLKLTGEEIGRDNILNDEINVSGINAAYSGLMEGIDKNIIQRKEILFLPVGSSEWKGFEQLYKEAAADDNVDVFVVPLPTFFKDIFGRVQATEEDMVSAVRYEDYPQDILMDMWTDYDISLHRPSVIYIQNPYDGENPCLTVPPQYYAANLKAFTERLIYKSPFIVDEFGADDYNDVYNMKHYVNAPGVIYADKVLVQSENMKNMYVDSLTGFAGEITRGHWKSVISVVRNGEEHKNPAESQALSGNGKKRILYCVGLNEIYEHEPYIIDKVKDRIKIFEENSDSIDVDITCYPLDLDDRKDAENNSLEGIKELIDYCSKYEWCNVRKMWIDDYEEMASDYDAYYGSPSPLVPVFSKRKKPVMIAAYDL